MREDYESTAHMSVRINVELMAEIERRRKLWGLRSRGEVLEAMLGWMVGRQPTDGTLNRDAPALEFDYMVMGLRCSGWPSRRTDGQKMA